MQDNDLESSDSKTQPLEVLCRFSFDSSWWEIKQERYRVSLADVVMVRKGAVCDVCVTDKEQCHQLT